MKTRGKYVVGMALGFSAGILGWSLLELVLSLQTYLSGYRMVLLLSGAVTGAALSAVLASMEGILHKNIIKMRREWLWGLLWGAVGGILGAFAGQMVFTMILPEGLFMDVYQVPYYIARIISWGILGAFIGTAEGMRARSGSKVMAGLLSGILAGLIGGSIVETGMVFFPSDSWLKLPGFLIIGLGTALLNLIIEEKRSYGSFRVLNGPQKGRKYLLNQRNITVGAGKSNDIIINGDDTLPESVAVISRKRKVVSIRRNSDSMKIRINDSEVSESPLKYEDVIGLGKIQFLYEVR